MNNRVFFKCFLYLYQLNGMKPYVRKVGTIIQKFKYTDHNVFNSSDK